MKKLVVLAIALGSLLTACSDSDTKRPDLWRRPVEPRLTGAQWGQCCETPKAPAQERCEYVALTAAEARTLLAKGTTCIDEAIATLRQARAMSDVAAAYYLRAQRSGEARDYLHALDATLGAIPSVENTFNRGLAEEALDLTDAAIASFNDVATRDRSQWGSEARQRRDRLRKQRASSAAVRWREGLQHLRAAIEAGDRAELAKRIESAPYAAVDYFEKELLSWAKPAQIRVYANVLSARLKGDQFPLDVAALCEKDFDRLCDREQAFGLVAAMRQGSLDQLQAIEAEAVRRRYTQLVARVQWMRGHRLREEGRFVEALAAYDRAAEVFTRLEDREGLFEVVNRRAGIYRDMGQVELSWQELFDARQYLPWVTQPRALHIFYGERSDTTRVLGHLEAALIYENEGVAEARRPGRQEQLPGALIQRARVHVERGRTERALEDINEALRVLPAGPRRTLTRAAAEEIRGRSLQAQGKPAAAADAFTCAIDGSTEDTDTTFVAALHAQRAMQLRRIGRVAEAEDDLRIALQKVDREARANLETRRKGEHENVWGAYFSRFEDTYRLLIRHFIETRQYEEALLHAENARAMEPLDLLNELPSLPRRFAAATKDLASMREALPDGTYVLHYTLLEDVVYTWIVSRTRLDFLQQPVTRENIERWSERVQTGRHFLVPTLSAAYDALIARPLQRIPPHPKRRLIFVPDGAMHGLPFAALRNARTKRHLVEDDTISAIAVAGSLKLYLFSLLRDAELPRRPDVRALLVGDPAFDRRLARGLEPLQYAIAEVDGIRPLYPRWAHMLGRDATVPRFLEHAPQYDVIHIAAHAEAIAARPWQSRIWFAPSGTHTGALQASELLTGLRAGRTRLAVLSACETAGAVQVRNEGVAPLVRSIVVAGVPGVAGSLWSVDDATAKNVMVSFHRHYRQGMDAAEAMKAAQLQLLSDDTYEWAAFQVIGHASSPFASTTIQ